MFYEQLKRSLIITAVNLINAAKPPDPKDSYRLFGQDVSGVWQNNNVRLPSRGAHPS
jgi:hypothetical protein